MPILNSELKFYKSSSGVGLGGAISATEITDGALNNIFDDVSSAEGVAGDIEYRCIFIKNTNALIDLVNTAAYIDENTGSADSTIEIGIGTNGISAAAQVIANENTAPVGVIFDSPTSYATGLSIGTLPANGGYQAIWLRRVISAGADAQANDYARIAIQGETTS